MCNSSASCHLYLSSISVILQVLGKGADSSTLVSQVNEITKYFAYLGVVSFVSSFLQMTMWQLTGKSLIALAGKIYTCANAG